MAKNGFASVSVSVVLAKYSRKKKTYMMYVYTVQWIYV